jgi:hypothetical protein
MKFLFIPLIALAGLCLAGCTRQTTNAPSPFLRKHLGEFCTVQLRRDALGGAASLPVAPLTDNINGADVEVGGKLEAVEGDGIVVRDDAKEADYWIPNHAILLVLIPHSNK